MRRAPSAGAVVVAILVAAGCGSSSTSTTVPAGTKLTVYSSLPFEGPERQEAIDMRNAEQLALAQVHNRVGRYTLRYRSLDDATPKKNGWEPGATSGNARTATQDHTTIAYLGDLDSGASAISIPVLNAVGILQVSPASTAVGLTQGGVGADKGEPDKYYPSETRTFGRVVPSDTAQGAAIAKYMTQKGCTELYVLNDTELYDGDGLAQVVAADAGAAGIQVAGDDVIDPGATNVSKQAQEVRSSEADCVFFGVVAADRAAHAINAINATLPRAKLFAPAQLANPGFTRALTPAAQAATFMTSPIVPPAAAPTAAREFTRRFTAAYHHAPSSDAVFGYMAMQAVIASIRNAGAKGDDRPSVIKAFLGLRNQASPLGSYSIDRRGDTSLNTFAGYRIRNGRPVADPAFGATG